MKRKLNFLLGTSFSLRKKILNTGAIIFFLTGTAFAKGEKVNDKAVNSLKNDYKNAKEVQWHVSDNFTSATFYSNNEYLEVFYNQQGETIAKGRSVKLTDLPLKAQKFLEEKYKDYRVAEAIEYSSEETGLCYFLSVAKKDTKTKILEVNLDGKVTVFKY